MKSVTHLFVAGIVFAAGAAYGLDIDLSAAACTAVPPNRVQLGQVGVAGSAERYDAEFAWDGGTLAFTLVSAAASSSRSTEAAGLAISLSESHCELAGSKAFVLRDVQLPGTATKYWARLAWDAEAFRFAVSDYGAETASGIAKKYLLAFHACESCADLGNHMTYLAQSDNGSDWSLLPGYTARQGSVPDIVRRGNTLYVFNPGKVFRYRFDTDAWETDSTRVSITRGDGSRVDFVDPSPLVDDDGRIVLVYLDSTGFVGDPATCAGGTTSCTKAFGSAVEVAGSDGTAFIAQEGSRVEVALDTSGGVDAASDPDVFKVPGGYVIYVSRGADVQAFISTTLHGSYAPMPGLTDAYLHRQGEGGVPAGIYDEDTDSYWTLAHRNFGAAGQTRILRAVTAGLDTRLGSADYSDLITSATFSELAASASVASPGICLNRPY